MNILGLTYRATKQTRVLVDLYEFLASQDPDAPERVNITELLERFKVAPLTLRNLLKKLVRHKLIVLEKQGRCVYIKKFVPLNSQEWRDFVENAFSEDARRLIEGQRTRRKLTRRLYQSTKREIRLLRRVRKIDKNCPFPKTLPSNYCRNLGIDLIYRAHGRDKKVVAYSFGDEETRIYVNHAWSRAVQIYPKSNRKERYGRCYVVFLEISKYASPDYAIKEIRRYRSYCDKRGWTGTRWVMSMLRFLKRLRNRILKRIRCASSVKAKPHSHTAQHATQQKDEVLDRESTIAKLQRLRSALEKQKQLLENERKRELKRKVIDTEQKTQSKQDNDTEEIQAPQPQQPTTLQQPAQQPTKASSAEVQALITQLQQKMQCDAETAQRILTTLGAERVYQMLNRKTETQETEAEQYIQIGGLRQIGRTSLQPRWIEQKRMHFVKV